MFRRVVLVVLCSVIICLRKAPLNRPSRATFLAIRIINWYYWAEAKIRPILVKCSVIREDEVRISKIITYPIKSCRGVELDRCYIDNGGLLYDRMYMFGVWEGTRFRSITQRDCPRLCLCTVEIVDDQFKIRWPGSTSSFYLPTSVTEEYLENHSSQKSSPVHLWEVNFETLVLDNVIPVEFIQDMKLDPETKMLYSRAGKFVKTNVPKPLKTLRATKFQEYFPLLLMSEVDLMHFRSRFDNDEEFPISFANFRPNIVVTGVQRPYSIDLWSKITMGGHRWLIISKCPRCSIPNINYETGEVDPKSRVSKELMKYRRCDPGQQYFMFLGVHGINLEKGYNLLVGDPVKVLQKAINYYKPLE